jgi:multidrug efflux pump subunit AcrB
MCGRGVLPAQGSRSIEPHTFSNAVLEAAQQRLRPILLTTATTVGGLLPLWLGGGPMWEPMAIAIIVGLVFATVLTLGVVPVLYSLFFKVKYTGVDGTNAVLRAAISA